MPDFLDVPEMGIRRRSEGCLEAFQSNGLVSCRCKQCEEGVGCVKHDAERPRERSATTAGAGVESNLMDVLRKNYDIGEFLFPRECSTRLDRVVTDNTARDPEKNRFPRRNGLTSAYHLLSSILHHTKGRLTISSQSTPPFTLNSHLISF
ncbi:hypothetical protein Q1695_005975 [Nippostrongylus brasiliensis]|nr:hypothetical protein Q1695_005975 [Nippostrongylus brasiliensis]